MVAVYSLLDFSTPKELLKYSKIELITLITTLIITATIGIKEGIFIGVMLSLIMLIYRSTKPHFAVLGQVKDTTFYRNVDRFEGLLNTTDDVLIVRFDAQLYFANISFFKDKLEEFVAAKGSKLKLIIIDGESINSIDSSGVFMLKELIRKYKNKGIDIDFSGLKGPVRDVLDKSGVIEKIDYSNCFMSIQQAVNAFEDRKKNKQIERKYFEYIKQTNR